MSDNGFLFVLVLAVLVFVGGVGYEVGKHVGLSKMRKAERLREAARAETDLETKAMLYEEANQIENPDS